MRDEQHGLPCPVPEPQQLQIEVVAHDLVECAERLIHQQQFRLERKCARDRGALLHAAGQLPGKPGGEIVEPDEAEVMLRPLLALRLGQAENLQRQRHIAGDRAPRIERRRLEDIAVLPRQPRLAGGEPVDRKPPAGRLLEIGDDPQQGGLAAAGGAYEGDELAGFDRKIDLRQCIDRPVSRLEHQGQALDVDHARRRLIRLGLIRQGHGIPFGSAGGAPRYPQQNS